ncbi:hypothetical protein [Acidisoma sp. 7E03]
MSASSKWDDEFPPKFTHASALGELQDISDDCDAVGEILVALARGPDDLTHGSILFLGHALQQLADRATEVMRRTPK